MTAHILIMLIGLGIQHPELLPIPEPDPTAIQHIVVGRDRKLYWWCEEVID